MKTITTFLFIAICEFCFAGGNTNVIAISNWSKPVETHQGATLRARMLIAQEHSPAHVGPLAETEFYLEFENVSGAIRAPLQFYFDPQEGLNCVMRDANGATVSTGGRGSGGGAGPAWITLPYDSTIRLRANMYGYGSRPGDGLNLTLYPGQAWQLRASDTNVYYLSGTFIVTTPTNFVPRDFEAARALWSGTLELPPMKISVPK